MSIQTNETVQLSKNYKYSGIETSNIFGDQNNWTAVLIFSVFDQNNILLEVKRIIYQGEKFNEFIRKFGESIGENPTFVYQELNKELNLDTPIDDNSQNTDFFNPETE